MIPVDYEREGFCVRGLICHPEATRKDRRWQYLMVNGRPIGAELQLGPGDERTFRIRILGTAPIAAVQIIHAGHVLADLPTPDDELDFDATWSDERPGRPLDDAYYYVRARQIDGHCLWLSPWWVDLAT